MANKEDKERSFLLKNEKMLRRKWKNLIEEKEKDSKNM